MGAPRRRRRTFTFSIVSLDSTCRRRGRRRRDGGARRRRRRRQAGVGSPCGSLRLCGERRAHAQPGSGTRTKRWRLRGAARCARLERDGLAREGLHEDLHGASLLRPKDTRGLNNARFNAVAVPAPAWPPAGVRCPRRGEGTLRVGPVSHNNQSAQSAESGTKIRSENRPSHRQNPQDQARTAGDYQPGAAPACAPVPSPRPAAPPRTARPREIQGTRGRPRCRRPQSRTAASPFRHSRDEA